MMPFEDNAHLQRHLGTNKHVNTLLKKRGINIDEVDMDEIVDITKLSQEELKEYVRNTDRYNELTVDVIVEKDRAFERYNEIDKILGEQDHSVECDDSGSDDEAITRRKCKRLTKCKLSCDERFDISNEQLILREQTIPRLMKKWGETVITAREIVLKELRTEYLTFLKMKEKRLEKERKESEKDRKEAEKQAEKDKRQAEKDEERRRKNELAMLILQAKADMYKPK
jgi:hypothetical protein